MILVLAVSFLLAVSYAEDKIIKIALARESASAEVRSTAYLTRQKFLEQETAGFSPKAACIRLGFYRPDDKLIGRCEIVGGSLQVRVYPDFQAALYERDALYERVYPLF
ncbi:MAG: hypothetical protein HYT34_02540 [Candidatus Ryanbacteria bacterium]|nr:hypothetical protein [Candidatus Ryanbacteria bacterium]